MNIEFNNQLAIITGATRGIGKQIANDLLDAGATVLITGTNQEQIETLNKKAKPNCHYYCVDFKDSASTNDFIDILLSIDKIDICINNAGIIMTDPIDKAKPRDYNDIFSVNTKAPFLIINAVSQIMKKRNYGKIVNISSIFSAVSLAERSIYTSSKFALNGLTLTSALDLAQYNILVNSVSPGYTLTDMVEKTLSKNEISEISQKIPLGRLASTKEISRLVIFLASQMNSYITGQNIIIDGGYTCQ